MKHLRSFVTASIMMLCIGLSAQPMGQAQGRPQGTPPAPPVKMTPEEIAKKETDRMKAEVNLTDKQYKKVYNLIKKDRKYRQSQAEQQFGGGMPPQGGPGMGGPGGMGNPGGMMGWSPEGMGGGPGGGSMGGPGGMGGGMPPQGAMGQGPRPEGGQPGMGPGEDIVTEEYLEKQDKKLKKILTEEQYSQWRSRHPAEHLALPPIEIEIKK